MDNETMGAERWDKLTKYVRERGFEPPTLVPNQISDCE